MGTTRFSVCIKRCAGFVVQSIVSIPSSAVPHEMQHLRITVQRCHEEDTSEQGTGHCPILERRTEVLSAKDQTKSVKLVKVDFDEAFHQVRRWEIRQGRLLTRQGRSTADALSPRVAGYTLDCSVTLADWAVNTVVAGRVTSHDIGSVPTFSDNAWLGIWTRMLIRRRPCGGRLPGWLD
ncbi:hypothetical protein H9Q69_003560 [Fusarium xylarioides]|nr:hypothetical protein H9Q69_003560 [Fusarium xylarioides]